MYSVFQFIFNCMSQFLAIIHSHWIFEFLALILVINWWIDVNGVPERNSDDKNGGQ